MSSLRKHTYIPKIHVNILVGTNWSIKGNHTLKTDTEIIFYTTQEPWEGKPRKKTLTSRGKQLVNSSMPKLVVKYPKPIGSFLNRSMEKSHMTIMYSEQNKWSKSFDSREIYR